MEKIQRSSGGNLSEKKRRKKTEKKLTAAFSALIIFLNFCLMSFTAVTAEGRTICGKEEHTHTEACYETDGEEKILICPLEEHQHDESCYAPEQTKEQPQETSLEGEQTQEESSEIAKVQSTGVIEEPGEPEVLADVEEPEKAAGPLILKEENIEAVNLSFRPKGNSGAWTPVAGAVTVPGDASLRLEISYEKISLDTLIQAGGELKYENLPELLKNPQSSGDLTSGSETIGTVTADGRNVLLKFNLEWLERLQEKNNDTLSGSFFVEAEIDLSQVKPGDTEGELVFGNVTVKIPFDDDILASASEVTVEKTVGNLVKEENGKYYLEYTLKVSVPADSAAVPAVRVEDSFGSGASWVEGYVEESISPKTENIDKEALKTGKLIWTIGDMKPGEIKTLTYRVQLKDNYAGAHPRENSALKNKATVYSKTFPRHEAEAVFQPKAEMEMSKKSSVYTPNPSGGGTITYYIWIQAKKDNTWTLDNVKISDSLTDQINKTDLKLLPYLEFDESSFKLYQGGAKDQSSTNGLKEVIDASGFNPQENGKNPVFVADKKGFDYYVGDMKPGECKTLVYVLNVKEEFFTLGNGNTEVIRNRAYAKSDDTRTDGNQMYTAYNCNSNVAQKRWDRKLKGTEIQEATTIAIPEKDSVYKTPKNPEQNRPSDFSVPKGSYQYKIVVNEAGDWDVSAATLADTIGKNLAYTGYLKIDSYIVTNAPQSGITDEAAAEHLTKYNQKEKTVWLNIDGLQTFSFQPDDFDLNGKKAYLLTYYAKPKDLGENASVVVKNDFEISGDVVGSSGTHYRLDGIKVTTNVTVQGSTRFAAKKQSWYYELPQDNDKTSPWKFGTIYWAIEVGGTGVPKGLMLKDVPVSNHAVYADSVVAVYQGTLEEDWELTYHSFAELKKAGLKELTSGEHYTAAMAGSNLQITFPQAIPFDEEKGESLYIIIKTAPTKAVPTDRSTLTCNNDLQSSGDGGKTWTTENRATEILHGTGGCFKEYIATYTNDKSGWKKIAGKEDKVIQSEVKEFGTYVEWRVHANYDGAMHGLLEMRDLLPKEMEPVYVRYFWMGDDYRNVPNLTKPTTPEITELEGKPEEWERMVLTANEDRRTWKLTCISYYNKKSGEIRWNVQDVAPGGTTNDARAVEFQILCRVTDEKLLLGGGTATYENRFEAEDEYGRKGSDTAAVTLKKNSLTKKETYDETKNGGIYPFEIKVNELGEDLIKGKDTVTLIDELSKTLILDTSSVKIMEANGAELPKDAYTMQLEKTEHGQILKLEIPDDKALIITYNTRVNAAPGDEIEISNKAHWEGYAVPEGGAVEDEDFTYSVGGTVDFNAEPELIVQKRDRYNAGQLLPGAEFEVREMMLDDAENIVEKPSTPGETVSEKKTTGEDGKATFSRTSDGTYWMEFNTIYRLKETKAPDGYVKDETPHYFVIAKLDKKLKTYPEDFLEAAEEKGVYIYYGGAEYTYEAYNGKGEADVGKKFFDHEGHELTGNARPDGNWKFGLFDPDSTDAKPLQIVTIHLKNGEETYFRGDTKVNEPRFTNLELNKEYEIYELDDENNPVKAGAVASCNGKTFTVTYENGNTVTVNDDGKIPKVTVCNTEKRFRLPETGGRGTKMMYILGTAAAVWALLILLYNRKKKSDKPQ